MRVLTIGVAEVASEIQQALVAAPDVVYVGQCATVERADRHLAQDNLDIVLLDLRLPDSLPFLETMATRFPSTAPIALVSQDQMDLLQQALLAGARGFSLLPLEAQGLLPVLRQVRSAEVKRRQRSGVEGPGAAAGPDEVLGDGQVIALSGIKGGVGRTTIAVNLAVALAQDDGGSVALVEGSPSMGDVALMLNACPRHALADLVTEPDRLDADLIRGALVQHTSGVKVLFGARDIGESAQMTQDLIAAALCHLRGVSRYVVVDTPSEVNDVLTEVLAVADLVVVVTTPELTSLRRAQAFLQEARAGDFPMASLRLVLNREGVAGGISNADIAERLGIPVAVALPDDPALVTYSINRGVPLVQSHPKSLLARRVHELAGQVTAQMASHRGLKAEGSREQAAGPSLRLRVPRAVRVRGTW
jgi:pilus assembly protein CpaE